MTNAGTTDPPTGTTEEGPARRRRDDLEERA